VPPLHLGRQESPVELLRWRLHDEHHPEDCRQLDEDILADRPVVSDFVLGLGTGCTAMETAAGIGDERDDVTGTVIDPTGPDSLPVPGTGTSRIAVSEMCFQR
jgi:cysteine synthase